MECRRRFLIKLLPRLFGVGGALSFSIASLDRLMAASPAGSKAVNLNDPKYRVLVNELVEKHGFARKALTQLFQGVVFQEDIIDKFERPAERLPFYKYRKIFIKDDMIKRGHAYLNENRALLTEIEKAYGVDKEIITSILGVETRFGKPGIERYRAFDIFNTAYSLYPRREKFYRGEMIAFLLLCREEGIDPFSIKSSYAGAFGVPQFIPSSFLNYAVDFDRDGKRDLWHSKGDIFGSVANYLKTFGWQPGQLTYLPARIIKDTPEARKMAQGGFRKTVSVAEAIDLGIEIPPPAKRDDSVSFAYYEPKKGNKDLIALFGNFRAITRYNISVHYALTIVNLSRIFASKASG
ncbi:MAG: lytic transglycosylase domain-containing protein [Nitrospiria bacterium]